MELYYLYWNMLFNMIQQVLGKSSSYPNFCADFFVLIIIKSQRKMSNDTMQSYYYQHSDDLLIEYFNWQPQEQLGIQFPEEYQKNASDCLKRPSKTYRFKKINSITTLDLNKTSQKITNQSNQKEKQIESFNSERFIQQTSSYSKDIEKSVSSDKSKQSKQKTINKNKQTKKQLVTLNNELRLQQSRQIKIRRYKEKKLKRNWERGIMYEQRKKLAFRRKRIQGRFQSKNDQIVQMIEQKKSTISIQQEFFVQN